MSDEAVELDGVAGDPDQQSAVAQPGRRRTRLIRVGLVVVGVLAGYYLITLWQVVRTGHVNEPDPAEAIVVLGAAQYDGRPSPQLAARLDHAVDLYGDGVAPVVMVTGGKQPGDRFTEAEASARYLIERGVPESAIMREDAGRTTFESLEAAADLLLVAELDQVVLVTDPYHALRSRLTANELGLDASVSPTPTSVVDGWTEFRRQLDEAGGVAVGRLVGFERLSALTG